MVKRGRKGARRRVRRGRWERGNGEGGGEGRWGSDVIGRRRRGGGYKRRRDRHMAYEVDLVLGLI